MNDYEKLLYKTKRQKRQLRILLAKNKKLKDYINQLEKQLEHYKLKEIERLNENVLQIRNDCLEGYIKANRIGG